MGGGPQLFLQVNMCDFSKQWIKCDAVKLSCIFLFQYYTLTSNNELSAYDAFVSHQNVTFHENLGGKKQRL